MKTRMKTNYRLSILSTSVVISYFILCTFKWLFCIFLELRELVDPFMSSNCKDLPDSSVI